MGQEDIASGRNAPGDAGLGSSVLLLTGVLRDVPEERRERRVMQFGISSGRGMHDFDNIELPLTRDVQVLKPVMWRALLFAVGSPRRYRPSHLVNSAPLSCDGGIFEVSARRAPKIWLVLPAGPLRASRKTRMIS